MPIMGVTKEPILSRMDRLDNMLKYLEEIKGLNRSPRSSCESTPSSGTLTSEGHESSLGLSPKSLENHCRPIDVVITQTEAKGNLIERLDRVESPVLKLEEEEEKMKKEKSPHRKGLNQLLKECVKRNGKHNRVD